MECIMMEKLFMRVQLEVNNWYHKQRWKNRNEHGKSVVLDDIEDMRKCLFGQMDDEIYYRRISF